MKRKWSHNPDAHRKLKVPRTETPTGRPDEPQKGDDVKQLQRECNKRIRNLKLPIKPLKIDGECGRQTVSVARRCARHLGVGLKTDGVSVYVQKKVRHPETRTKTQIRRGQDYREEHIKPPATVKGNTVTGGASDRERIVAAEMQAAHLYYTGASHRFYSQPGRWTVDHGITGEHPGERSDCSQFQTAMYHSAGAPDPNGTGFTSGWTGSLAAHMTEIRRDQLQPGDQVIYFHGATSYHVEGWVGNGDGHTTYAQLAAAGSPLRDRTVGHGSPPVDFGDIDMASGPRFFRCPGLK